MAPIEVRFDLGRPFKATATPHDDGKVHVVITSEDTPDRLVTGWWNAATGTIEQPNYHGRDGAALVERAADELRRAFAARS